MRKLKTILAAAVMTMCMAIPAFAGTDFSDNWREVDPGFGQWRYYENGTSLATDAWIHDHGYWYLVDENGDMAAGFVKSFGKYYYLDPMRGTGHFGRMFISGDSYAGIDIQTDMSSAYEGALTKYTLNQIRADSSLSYLLDNAQDISGTRHIEAN